MNRESLTGSQELREKEILQKWLVFSPISDENIAISGVLYTVPIGQNFAPTLIVNSGSYEKDDENFINIQKNVHLFSKQQDAAEFITKIGGSRNLTTIKKRKIDGELWYEVQLLNYPKLEISLSIDDFSENKGFRIEILKSSSFGYQEINRKVEMDQDKRIISETYLKFFDIEVDK